MAAVSLAIIGKANEPLYLRDFVQDSEVDDAALLGLSKPEDTTTPPIISLPQEFILHAALDRFVQMEGPPPGFAWRNTTTTTPGTTAVDPQFVGLLGPWEDVHVYGWMSTTHIKFLVACRDNGHNSTTVRTLLRQLHQLYVEYRLNPLGSLTGPIQSKAFDDKIQQTIETYNRHNGGS